MARATAIGWIALALIVGVAAALWQEIPRWRASGTASMPVSSVGYAPHLLICPDRGATIALLGDSHVAGSRMREDGMPFGLVLEQALEGRVKVALFGGGGQTAAMGEAAWRARNLPRADLVIFAYGTNDAAPRGWLRNKNPVPVATYRAAMTRQIAAARVRGAQVAVMAPPPGGSAAIKHRLSPYRAAARDVGRILGVPVLDPADAFAACASSEPLLMHDALHMNEAGHRCLGRWLAQRLCPSTSH